MASGTKRARDETTSEPDAKRVDSGNRGVQYWLVKSEPEPRIVNGVNVSYSLDEFEADGVAEWDGVRNYAARNCMMEMKVGDQVFFYHSNTKEPGIVGIAEVCKESYPDETAFDPKDPHYDEKSKRDKPRWYRVDIQFKRRLLRKITLKEMKEDEELKANFGLFRRPRQSVVNVSKEHWEYILKRESM